MFFLNYFEPFSNQNIPDKTKWHQAAFPIRHHNVYHTHYLDGPPLAVYDIKLQDWCTWLLQIFYLASYISLLSAQSNFFHLLCKHFVHALSFLWEVHNIFHVHLRESKHQYSRTYDTFWFCSCNEHNLILLQVHICRACSDLFPIRHRKKVQALNQLL